MDFILSNSEENKDFLINNEFFSSLDNKKSKNTQILQGMSPKEIAEDALRLAAENMTRILFPSAEIKADEAGEIASQKRKANLWQHLQTLDELTLITTKS